MDGAPMPYVVELKLPLPAAPLSEGHRFGDRKPIPYGFLMPAEFHSADEARRHAARIQALGYSAMITDPAGNRHLALPN